MFNRGDIIAINRIREDMFNMVEQANVPEAAFPIPALVTDTNEMTGEILVHWVHPVTMREHDWTFRKRHFDKMEMIE